ARITLESHRGAVQIVLRDLAVDGARHLVAEPRQDCGEYVGRIGAALQLVAHLEAALVPSGTFPSQLRARSRGVAIDPEPEHVIAPRQVPERGVVPPVLESARER